MKRIRPGCLTIQRRGLYLASEILDLLESATGLDSREWGTRHGIHDRQVRVELVTPNYRFTDDMPVLGAIGELAEMYGYTVALHRKSGHVVLRAKTQCSQIESKVKRSESLLAHAGPAMSRFMQDPKRPRANGGCCLRSQVATWWAR